MNIIEWNGEIITEPGIYSGITMDNYHGNNDMWAGKCVSTGGVRAAGGRKGSAYDYWAYSPYNPDKCEFKETRVMRIGKAVHLFVLGDEPFGSQFVEIPKDVLAKNGAKSTKAYREWLAEQDPKLDPISPDELDQVRKASEQISNNHHARILLDGLIEHTIVWQDEKTGLWLRARPDTLPLDGVVGDLKGTEADVSTWGLENKINDLGYHCQLAMISEGMKAVGYGAPQHHGLVFAMLKEPYHIVPVEVNDDWIEHGRRMMRRGIDRIAEGFETGVWKGRAETFSPTGIVELHTPNWMLTELGCSTR